MCVTCVLLVLGFGAGVGWEVRGGKWEMRENERANEGKRGGGERSEIAHD